MDTYLRGYLVQFHVPFTKFRFINGQGKLDSFLLSMLGLLYFTKVVMALLCSAACLDFSLVA